MTVEISDADMAQLVERFPELDLSAAERQQFLRHMGTTDVQAAPGSGKTTLLASKLSLIASKWPLLNQGVCVLTHTNVARKEIESRLAASAEGASLFRYPHFIGTIQSFVHQHLALPLLWSDGRKPEFIDDDYFGDQAERQLGKAFKLKGYLKRQPGAGKALVRSLHFAGPSLCLGYRGGKLPGTHTDSFKEALRIKHKLAEYGIFRYEDMFAYALRLLNSFPHLKEVLSYRYPAVFIDEMQDTDALQEQVLDCAFGSTVVLQRLGDVNQAIFLDGKTASRTFPKVGHIAVATSKRFGQAIADIANALRLEGPEIIGEGKENAVGPALFLFDNATASRVIAQFGQYVARWLTPEELRSRSIRAVCARAQRSVNELSPHHIQDYWPAYELARTRPSVMPERFLEALRVAQGQRRTYGNLDAAARGVRIGMLAILRQVGLELAKNSRSWGAFIRDLPSDDGDVAAALNLAVRNLTLLEDWPASEPAWLNLMAVLYDTVRRLLPDGITQEKFCELPYLAWVPQMALLPDVAGSRLDANVYREVVNDTTVEIEVSTIAAAKGETHCATLVLESVFKSNFDISNAIPFICGMGNLKELKKQTVRDQMRNLFVAVSRPKRLVCLAAHKDRVAEIHRAKLSEQGWVIVDC